MFKIYLNKIFLFLLISFTFINYSFSDIIKKIEITGNERIPTETIKIFSSINVSDDISELDVNNVFKKLYDTNYFKDIQISFMNNIFMINVEENPIINRIKFENIKSSRIKDLINSKITLKNRSSYNEILLKQDRDKILSSLKEIGYFFSSVDIFVEDIANNQVNIFFDISLGEKSKIKKISFIGDKKIKDKKLRNVIVSEEFKFWKFLSGKKYLNENVISLDKRLIRNFYLNKGYYNVQVNSSFAKLINDTEFELIYNINANDKVYFGDLFLNLPDDYDEVNFKNIQDLFDEIKGSNYSLNKITEILNEIDNVILNEQYESIKASVDEKLADNRLNIEFNISETEKLFIERINIYGNNVTSENVIRNQLFIDEGDPFNEILETKSINNIKSLNFFKDVRSEILPGTDDTSKIINISVEEKPTGEIMAGAGFGTTGTSFVIGVKENNFLGRGISLDSNLNVGTDSVKGELSFVNPQFNNSDKSLSFNISATEIDRLKASGYKTNRTGFSIGTKFEYLDDLFLNLGNSNYYEKLETDSSASTLQKTQEGDYFDSFLRLSLDYDKRNQKFQTSDGFRSIYSTNLPLISESYTFSNTYKYKQFTELYENNITSFSFLIKTANSISNENIKLSERLYIPSGSLRGFESGKVGPKDGDDYIGGNFISALNFTSTLPHILPNSQNTDFLLFFDVANIWGVDYDSSLDDDAIRSSVGIGIDWFTPVGPLNFSFAQPLAKGSNDTTESFRFNLGTTF